MDVAELVHAIRPVVIFHYHESRVAEARLAPRDFRVGRGFEKAGLPSRSSKSEGW
jgi:hypothetical protein